MAPHDPELSSVAPDVMVQVEGFSSSVAGRTERRNDLGSQSGEDGPSSLSTLLGFVPRAHTARTPTAEGCCGPSSPCSTTGPRPKDATAEMIASDGTRSFSRMTPEIAGADTMSHGD